MSTQVPHTTPDGARAEVIRELVRAICELQLPHPTRVGVDGGSNAGKTTLSDELAAALQAAGRQTLRCSFDNFHPKGYKYRTMRGEWTPQLFFDEGYDYATFRAWMLDPLAPGGSRRCCPAILNSYTDVLLREEWHELADDAVVIVDGILLLHPEIAVHWDYLIWLEVDVETMIARACPRDAATWGSAAAVERRYRQFREPVQALYQQLANPAIRAHAVVDNRDVERPRLLRHR